MSKASLASMQASWEVVAAAIWAGEAELIFLQPGALIATWLQGTKEKYS